MRIPLSAFLLSLSLLFAQKNATAAETLLDVDFAKPMKDASVEEKGSFEGVLPAGCKADFPAWNDSAASASAGAEDGRSFLRIHVDRNHGVQFNWELPNFNAPGHYKLTSLCRLRGADLEAGVRQLPAPYGMRWSSPLASRQNEWTSRSLVFSVNEKQSLPLGLFIYPGGTGEVDVAALKLERLSVEEAALSVERPSKDVKNFFRNSRLPLGLQAGWSVAREFEGGKIESDPAEPGPSGAASLKLESGKPLAIFSEPFQTASPFERNFVSFACKGEGSWKASILCAGVSGRSREIAAKQFQASAEWKIETIELKLDDPAKGARAFTLKISGSGKLNLDEFQAWAGSPERKFQPQGACEAALAFPNSELSDARIQFADEKPEIEYFVSGELDGAVLKLEVFDVDGKSKKLPDVKLSRGADGKSSVAKGSFRYDVFGSERLGQFRVEAFVEKDGKRVSPFNELLATRIRRPVHLKEDAPDSPFGAHFMASPLTIREMKAAGVNWARLHDAGTDYIGWFHLEPEKGKWQFHDEEIKLYRDSKIEIFAGLQTAPKWASLYASSGKKDFNGYFDRYFEPSDMEAWANYVKTVAKRYRGVINEYFIWNEPWGAGFWHSSYNAAKKDYEQSREAGANFAKLSEIAYIAAKEGNPYARVAGFNSVAGESGRKWTKSVFDAGAYGYCDMIDYHFYTTADQGFPGDLAEKAFDDAIGYIKEKTPNFAKPVYMSEGQGNSGGSAGGPGSGLYKRALPWTAENDDPSLNADKTCRFVVANIAAGSSKVFLYSAHCYESLASESSFTTLAGPDGYPQVELAAFSNMAWLLEDAKFVKRIQLAPEVFAFLFEGGREGSVAVVSSKRNVSFALPETSEFKSLDLFGNKIEGAPKLSGKLVYAQSKLPASALEKSLLKRN